MRTLIAYLNRRGIKDIESWRKKKNLNSLESVKEWCTKNGIALAMPDGKAAGLLRIVITNDTSTSQSKTQPQAKPKENETPVSAVGEVTSKSWHVPAAERPLPTTRKSKKSRTTSRKTSRSKKSEQ